ncbi:MAG TPA: type II secretion system F family protein, partial [Candidatus Berkiella sp.]|nr:type II secretion system F family protein [Candidatus Berkiella sp.]
MIISLESGYSFSKALSKHSMVFQPLIIAMVEIGENTGKLEISFLQIREYLETEQSTKQRIKTALRYPIIVIAAILTAIIIINIMVIPAFRDFFSNFGATLPLPTRILITTSDLFVRHGWLISGLCILSAIGAVYYAHTPQGKWWISCCKLKIPFVGSIVRRSIYARFCRAFAMT